MDIEVLWDLLAKPSDAKYAYTLNIQSLIDEYPQSGLLRALLAGNGNAQNVQRSAVYFNPAILYKIVNHPDSLPVVRDDQVMHVEEPETNEAGSKLFNADPFSTGPVFHTPVEEPGIDTATGYSPASADAAIQQDLAAIEFEPAGVVAAVDPDVVENIPVAQQEQYTTDAGAPDPEPVYEDVKDTAVDTYAPQPAESEQSQEEEKADEIEKKEPVYPFTDKTEYFHQDIDDEIYDEIVSIEDINLEQLATFHSGYIEDKLDKPAESEIPSEISSTDHFVFAPDLTEQQEEETDPVLAENTTPANTTVTAAWETPNKKQDVSKYYDEKLPYTFMWWLDKTRREYASTYQPYVYNYTPNTPIPPQPVKRDNIDELQQQYVENIFNLNAIDQLERNNSLKPYDNTSGRKEDKIIERFIQTEPQIKHPSGIKLDNENKAKKSSEDGDELVTETLARIYTEQMLYQKAISTYKKLMLKFPEKSLYFAGQIEQLEKKPN